MVDLSTKIGGVEIDPAIMNASGIYAYPGMLQRYGQELGALVIKSIGMGHREGYETPVLTKCSGDTWINAVGLTNPGYIEMREQLRKIEIKKPVIVSLFAEQPDDMAMMIDYLDDDCDGFELNVSCPNIQPGEETGMIIGKEPDLMKKYCISACGATEKPLIAKLTPATYIFDQSLFLEVAYAALEGGANVLSAINTIPGAMKIDTNAEYPVLTAKYGGLSGSGIKGIGVGSVYTLYEEFGDEVPLIGIGGIEDADDIVEYVLAGASGVGIGSSFIDKDCEEVENYVRGIKSELGEIVKSKNYKKLMDLRGKAHGRA